MKTVKMDNVALPLICTLFPLSIFLLGYGFDDFVPFLSCVNCVYITVYIRYIT